MAEFIANPTGYCQCGCGQKTAIAKKSNSQKGWVRGEHIRFCYGHSFRSQKPEYQIDPLSGCWNWTRCIGSDGYGLTNVRESGRWKARRAHRAMYERMVGPVPDKHDLDHICQNRKCVNPAHLQPLTRREHVIVTLQRLQPDPERGA